MGSVDSGWNCFRTHRKKRNQPSDVPTYVVYETEPEAHHINIAEDFPDFDSGSDELVQLPEPENVVVSECEVPRTTEEKLKYFETNFQDLISGLSTYEARTGDFKSRVMKIQIEMSELYKEKEKLELDIKELIDLIIKQRENATRVLGNRIVLREADVKMTRNRTMAIQKELSEKIDSLGLLKRKIDAAANTDFRLREEIKSDIRKTNNMVSQYMEEIELLNRSKIVQLKSLRQDVCSMCMPDKGHNSEEEKAKISGAVECLEHTVYKHTLQRMVAEYRSASRDLNAEVDFLIEQKHIMFEKIEAIESALNTLSVTSKSKDGNNETQIPETPKKPLVGEIPKLTSVDSTGSSLTSPISDGKLDPIVIPEGSSAQLNPLSSAPSIPSIVLSRSSISNSPPSKVSHISENLKPKFGFSLIRTLSRRSVRKDKEKSPRHKVKGFRKEKIPETEVCRGEIGQILEEKATLCLTDMKKTCIQSKLSASAKKLSNVSKIDILALPANIKESGGSDFTRRGSQLTATQDIPLVMYCDPLIESSTLSTVDLEILPSRPVSQHGSLRSIVSVESTSLQVQSPGGVVRSGSTSQH